MMYHYSWIQWLFFFFFYSFFGWCYESAYVSIKDKKLVNRGFIRGPFLPLYGTGAIMMLVVSMPFQDNIVFTYLAGCVGATILEYVTGVTMEALFKVRYWDYSNMKFNFQGHICLGATLLWGAMTVLMTRMVHKPVERLAFWLPESALTVVTMIVLVYFIVDFTLSFKAAMDLRDMLIKMEQAKEELVRMQKRLDVMIALADEAKENRKKERLEDIAEAKEAFVLRWDELVTGTEEKFAKIREALPYSDKLAAKKEELLELSGKFRDSRRENELTRFISDFMRRNLIKGNPGMVSKRFTEGLEELKRSAQSYKKEKKEKE